VKLAQLAELAHRLHAHAPKLKELWPFDVHFNDPFWDHFQHSLKSLILADQQIRCSSCRAELDKMVADCWKCDK
jgi:hypothetical protein